MEKKADFDVIIAGGGPAGLSALLWCAEFDLRAILLEKEPEYGGQLLCTHNAIKNYLGIEAANGRDLRDTFLRHIENIDSKRLTGAEIVDADLMERSVQLADGTSYSGRSIFIATGVRRRKLNVPGEEEFCARGILESGVKSKDEMSGKTVVIAGGGDAALENAVILSNTAVKVFVIHRRNEFSARREFVEKATQVENIEFVLESQIQKITGERSVDCVELKHLTSGVHRRIKTDAVLVRIGVEPNTELFQGQIEIDDAGYLVVDKNCRTSLPNIFAGGDVANPLAATISSAVGNGAVAVKAIFAILQKRL